MLDPAPYHDPELLKEITQGSEAAFRRLFDQYWDRIYSTAYAFTKSVEQSRDLAQDVFARIWLYRSSLEHVKDFEAYLFAIARNTARTALRQKIYIPVNDLFFETYFAAGEEPLDEALDLKDLEQLVEKGIAEMPPQQRRAFQLSRYQGMKIGEIAREMGVSAETAKSHLVRAIARLRKYLKDHKDLGVVIWILLFL